MLADSRCLLNTDLVVQVVGRAQAVGCMLGGKGCAAVLECSACHFPVVMGVCALRALEMLVLQHILLDLAWSQLQMTCMHVANAWIGF